MGHPGLRVRARAGLPGVRLRAPQRPGVRRHLHEPAGRHASGRGSSSGRPAARCCGRGPCPAGPRRGPRRAGGEHRRPRPAGAAGEVARGRDDAGRGDREVPPWATLPDLPTCATGETPCSPNVVDAPAIPNYATWGPRGALYVTDYGQAVIWKIPRRHAAPRVWFASDAARRDRVRHDRYRHTGPGARDLLITQQSTALDGSMPVNGKLYRLPVRPDRAARRAETLWTSLPGDLPDGFGIAQVGADLRRQRRPDQPARRLSPTARSWSGSPPCRGRARTARRCRSTPRPTPPSRPRVLVANQSFTGDSDHHAILDVVRRRARAGAVPAAEGVLALSVPPASLPPMSALAGLVDKGLVAPDWAVALAPVDDRIAAMGRFLRDEIAAGRGLPAGGRRDPAGVPATAGRRARAGRRPGPVPHAGPPDGAQLRGASPRPADAAQSWPTSTGAARRRRRRAARARGPDRLGGPGRDAAEQGADGPARASRRRTAAGAGRT